jgi:hypothetical protein
MSSATPSPGRRLVKTKGLSPRIRLESAPITWRLASPWGARSVLLITRRSDWEIPGPSLRGILSPAVTSITKMKKSRSAGAEGQGQVVPTALDQHHVGVSKPLLQLLDRGEIHARVLADRRMRAHAGLYAVTPR